jgi:hypothetical protein
MIKADKLKSKYKDIKINNAPNELSKPYKTVLLSILFICSKKYVSNIKKTPILPMKSYHWYVIGYPSIL